MPSTKNSESEIDKIIEQMGKLLQGMPRHDMRQLVLGAENSRGTIVGLAEGLKIANGKTTSAAVVIDPIVSILHHFDIEVELIKSVTLKSQDSPGGELTRAIKAVVPTLYSFLKSKHGLDTSVPDETNFERITLNMKAAGGVNSAESADGMTISLGKMYNDLKKLGDTKQEVAILPTPADLGATHGNLYTKKDQLNYHTGHFNETDGTLKVNPIKLQSKKGGTKDLLLVYGFIIPIHGTESNINVETPTATNSTAFDSFFGTSTTG